MALEKKQLINLLVGSALILLVTWPAFEIIYWGDAEMPAFLPVNAWLRPALLALLFGGLVIALFGMVRRVPWGYFLWSQTFLSFWVFLTYLGRSRADRDFVNFRGEDDAPLEGPPEVLWYRFALLVLVGLVIGYLPLIFRYLWRRHKARKAITKQENADLSESR